MALWSVGAVARDWRYADELLPICTIPYIPAAGLREDYPEFAFYARILRPAIWLGLLDYEERKESGERWPKTRDFTRKTTLFDEVLKFAVDIAPPTTSLN